MDKNIRLFMEKLKETLDFHRVKFVILYGSRIESRARKDSDYDFAIYYNGNKDQKYQFLLNVSFDRRFDVKIFQDLPLFIRKDVLRGKIIYAENVDFVYEVAYQTVKDLGRFEKYYYEYIRGRPIVR